jgi:hypothetical protein
MKEALELRMYFFTIYQLTGIQKGIQCGHVALEYAYVFGEEEQYIDFIENWKTWVILNGGTTSDAIEVESYRGSLNQIAMELEDNGIDHATFREPDLNDSLTALCFIADERVFNRVKYPDFEPSFDDDPETDEIEYEHWVEEVIGGKKNLFLRNLISGKRLA